MIVALAVTTAGLASAQETVTLPGNAAGLTTLTAVVSDQARITVPSAVTFNVTNIAAATVASGVTFPRRQHRAVERVGTLNVSLIWKCGDVHAPLGVADVGGG